MGRAKSIYQPPNEAQKPQKGHRLASMPLAVRAELPTARATSSPKGWQRERIQRAARICRCIARGHAEGKRTLHKMFVCFTWVWKDRHYACDPSRRIRFGYGTLRRLYYRWKASGGDPAALAVNYRAPVKIRPGRALDFARLCINSDFRSFAEAYARLSRPVATVYGYRLALRPKLLRRIVRLFAARRLVEWRTRKARAAVNSFAKDGAR